MNKKFFIFWAILLIFGSLFQSCKTEKEKTPQIDGDLYSDYILNYTRDEISPGDLIRIVFNKDIVGKEDLNKELGISYFEIHPNLDGKLFWESPSVLTFKGDNMKFSQEYEITLELAELLEGNFDNLPDEAFKYTFTTLPLDFVVQYGPFQLQRSSGDRSNVLLDGSISFNHFIDSIEVENMISISPSDSYSEINWSHNNLFHQFEIKGIERSEKIKALNIEWDAKSYNIDENRKKRLLIPSNSGFSVIEAGINPQNSREVRIAFSDFLENAQDFEGLIYCTGVNQKPEFHVDGNILTLIYRSSIEGEKTLKINKKVKSESDLKLAEDFSKVLYFSSPKPALKLLNSGSVTANVDQVILPFEAINLNSVDVEISKVYQNNMLQFLQYSNLDESYIPQEVSEIIWQQKVDLAHLGDHNAKAEWQRYGLDLMEFISLERGALYNVKIGFRNSYSNYPCENDNEDLFIAAGINELEDPENGIYKSIWKGWVSYPGRRYTDRDDPCKPMYYTNDNFIQQNILASNMGILAKYDGNDDLFLAVTDLNTGLPRKGVNLEIYSYQQQLIGEAITNEQGIVNMKTGPKAYFIIAKEKNEFGYLKMNEYSPLSMSEFEVEGKKMNSSLDGFIYGERGVWRPGDTLYLNFVLRDVENTIPEGHPILFELFDPAGKSYLKMTDSKKHGPIYNFICSTTDKAKTGIWRVVVKVGPHKFSKRIQIETIKPNRLKIDLKIPDEELVLNKSEIPIQVEWLTGIPGSELRTEVDLLLSNKKTKFKKYDKYIFDDVARSVPRREMLIYNENLDNNGMGSINLSLNKQYKFPGKVNALFKMRTYEKSGEYSIGSASAVISPYETYVGIKLPQNSWGNSSLEKDKDYQIPVVSLDHSGNVKAGRSLHVGIYHSQWRWWWDDSGNELAQFNSDKHIMAFRKDTVITDAKGLANIDLNIEDYGSYMIRVCDEESGHCTGKMFYTGYYGGSEEGKEFAEKLHFNSNKNSCKVGEKIELSIPSGKNANVLVTLENEGEVYHAEWVKSTEDILKYSFKAGKDMFPNIYAHVTVVQGLENKENDLPLRQYGVLNIDVLDDEKIISPVLTLADEVKPNSLMNIKVKEEKGNEMYYTLAVVDEGLLGLTNFKTPELYDHFFARQALLTKNWDNFGDVIDGKVSMFDRIISIGGDMELLADQGKSKANRFIPVVRYLGPFHLEKNAKNEHIIDIPNYTGSVRVMLVAANQKSYGSFEKNVKVKEDLMALLTAPRVLSPGETIEIPVTVFANDEKIKEVEVTMEKNDHFEVLSDRSKMLHFDKPGEKMVFFKCKTKENEGIGKLKVVAKSNANLSSQYIEIDVVNPNSYQRKSESYVLSPGEEKRFSIPLIGMEGTNNSFVECSSMPSLDLEDRISYLIRYPYGCVEQTTSSVFPQLYLDKLTDLSQDRKNKIKINIIQGIERLRSFQLNDNSLSYWPGDNYASDWGSVYAAHFLVEAKLLGYNTGSVLPGLLKYLKSTSKSFRRSSNINYIPAAQSYALMVLARAGQPDFASMNYLYKMDNLEPLNRWYLSLAYSFAGKKNIAVELLKGDNTRKSYYSSSESYGSHLRDYAVLLQAYRLSGKSQNSAKLLKEMIDIYKSRRWWSTQTLSWFFMTLGKNNMAGDTKMSFSMDGPGKKEIFDVEAQVKSFEFSENQMKEKDVSIKNNGKKELFVSYVSHGKAIMGDEGEKEESNLILEINFKDENGVDLDISRLKMGTEFKGIVKISKGSRIRNIDEMAVNQIFPSGWEVLNWRLEGTDYSNLKLDYQDIRDDRVNSFFDLRNKPIIIEIPLHASYVGNFYLPQLFVEAMYDDDVYAKGKGKWVEVFR